MRAIRRGSRVWLVLLWVALGVGGPVRAEVVTVRSGDSLSRLAAGRLGTGRDWPAIMLATNGRLDQGLGLQFIGDPNELAVGQKVFVPDRAETTELMRQWATYERAVLDMSLPEPWEIERDLVVARGDRIVAVTWARSGQYTEPFPTQASGDIWVTIEPYLQQFCRAAGSDDGLVERLEQRLGLPPRSNKTEFVRIEIDPASDGFFCPCTDPRVDRVGCELPNADLDPGEGYEWYPLWFFRQYHEAYGTARPTRFPWTSLGYTFDWGQEDEHGESEFIIREDTPIRVLETVPTATYCSATGG